MLWSRTWKRLHIHLESAGLVRLVRDPFAVRRKLCVAFVGVCLHDDEGLLPIANLELARRPLCHSHGPQVISRLHMLRSKQQESTVRREIGGLLGLGSAEQQFFFAGGAR